MALPPPPGNILAGAFLKKNGKYDAKRKEEETSKKNVISRQI
jgi:hypothetical protein